MRTRPSAASFAAAALHPRRIGIAASAFLLGLALAVQQTYPHGAESASSKAASAAAPQPTAGAPGTPAALQIGDGTPHLPVPGPADPGSPGSPLPSYNLEDPPSAGITSPSALRPAARQTHREPRDDIPWRSGCHPD